MTGLYLPALSHHDHERDMLRPVVVYGLHDPDPCIRSLAQQLQRFLDDRRARGIPTGGAF